MKERTTRFVTCVSRSLIAVSLCSQLCLAARAADVVALQPETAVIEETTPGPQTTGLSPDPSGSQSASGGQSPASSQPASGEKSSSSAQSSSGDRSPSAGAPGTTLQGGVHKRGRSEDTAPSNASESATGNSTSSATGNATSSVTNNASTLQGSVDQMGAASKLQSEQAKEEARTAAIAKLRSGANMSSDDFRALGIGGPGIDSRKWPFQKYGTIVRVYPGSPAEQAGIRKGEKEVWRKETTSDDQTLAVIFAKEGDISHITLIRDGKPVEFNLVNQNIEDIADPKIRREYEDLVRRLGYPQESVYAGTNFHDLVRVK